MQIENSGESLLGKGRDEKEVHRWMFSLVPLGVAFVFFFIFLLPLDIANKDIILVTGLAAGFAGLEAYWVYRGLRRKEGLTVILGVIGIALTGIFTWAYSQFLGEVLRQLFIGWLA